MSDLLGIGYSGLKAYSRALSTIGDNIAKSQSPRLHRLAGAQNGRRVTYDQLVPAELGKDFDALFADEPLDTEAQQQSINRANELCREKFAMYEKINEHLTDDVRAFRQVETTFFGIFRFGTENRSLLLLRCLEDYLAGQRFPLGLVHTDASVTTPQDED